MSVSYTDESKEKLMSCAKSIKIYCNDMLNDTDDGDYFVDLDFYDGNTLD